MTNYAKLRRNIIRAGLLAALVFNFQVARAAYTQLTPPAGWSAGAAGASSEFSMLLSKPVGGGAGATISAGRISALASLSVNGKAVTVPAKMTLASGASRVAAGLLFANPYVRTAVGVAGWLLSAKMVWDVASGTWRESRDTSVVQWYSNGLGPFAEPEAACKAGYPPTSTRYVFHSVKYVNSDRVSCVWADTALDNRTSENGTATSSNQGPGECPTGWTQGPDGCLSPAVTKDDFETKVSANPMPDAAPDAIPGRLPVGLPEIQPMFIPTGNPVPNPNYDPSAAPGPNNQPYNQPGVRVVPAPTGADPWRVDLQPTDRPTSSPDPTGPVTDDGSKPGDKPSDDKPGLCDMYPDILACAKPDLDTPSGEIPKAQRSVELSDSDLFGGGSCPANVYATIGHQYLQVWNWDQSCYYIVKYLKPVILVLGAFTALMIVSGGTKE